MIIMMMLFMMNVTVPFYQVSNMTHTKVCQGQARLCLSLESLHPNLGLMFNGFFPSMCQYGSISENIERMLESGMHQVCVAHMHRGKEKSREKLFLVIDAKVLRITGFFKAV